MHVSSIRSSHLALATLFACLFGPALAEADQGPDDFFERLHRRYLELDRFAEDVRVIRVVEDPATDGPPITTRIEVRVEVDGESCHVDRPTAAPRFLDALVDDHEGPSEADLELLPQLRLRFDPDPLANLRRAASTPYRPADLEFDTLDGREIARLELHAGSEEEPTGRIRFEVDVESMLIDRITGEEGLPGGLSRHFDVRVRDREIGRSPDAIVPSLDSGDRTPGPESPQGPVSETAGSI